MFQLLLSSHIVSSQITCPSAFQYVYIACQESWQNLVDDII